MIASVNQNQLQSSLAPLGDLLKALMFLSNLNGFPPHRQFKGLIKGKVLLGCGRKRAPSDSITFLSLFLFCMCITYLFCFQVLSQSSFYALLCLAWFCFFFFDFVLFCFFFHLKKNWKIRKIQKQCVFMCTLELVYLGWPLKQNFLNFVSFVA